MFLTICCFINGIKSEGEAVAEEVAVAPAAKLEWKLGDLFKKIGTLKIFEGIDLKKFGEILKIDGFFKPVKKGLFLLGSTAEEGEESRVIMFVEEADGIKPYPNSERPIPDNKYAKLFQMRQQQMYPQQYQSYPPPVYGPNYPYPVYRQPNEDYETQASEVQPTYEKKPALRTQLSITPVYNKDNEEKFEKPTKGKIVWYTFDAEDKLVPLLTTNLEDYIDSDDTVGASKDSESSKIESSKTFELLEDERGNIHPVIVDEYQKGLESLKDSDDKLKKSHKFDTSRIEHLIKSNKVLTKEIIEKAKLWKQEQLYMQPRQYYDEPQYQYFDDQQSRFTKRQAEPMMQAYRAYMVEDGEIPKQDSSFRALDEKDTEKLHKITAAYRALEAIDASDMSDHTKSSIAELRQWLDTHAEKKTEDPKKHSVQQMPRNEWGLQEPQMMQMPTASLQMDPMQMRQWGAEQQHQQAPVPQQSAFQMDPMQMRQWGAEQQHQQAPAPQQSSFQMDPMQVRQWGAEHQTTDHKEKAPIQHLDEHQQEAQRQWGVKEGEHEAPHKEQPHQATDGKKDDQPARQMDAVSENQQSLALNDQSEDQGKPRFFKSKKGGHQSTPIYINTYGGASYSSGYGGSGYGGGGYGYGGEGGYGGHGGYGSEHGYGSSHGYENSGYGGGYGMSGYGYGGGYGSHGYGSGGHGGGYGSDGYGGGYGSHGSSYGSGGYDSHGYGGGYGGGYGRSMATEEEQVDDVSFSLLDNFVHSSQFIIHHNSYKTYIINRRHITGTKWSWRYKRSRKLAED